MTVLTDKQRALIREIGRMGAFVISPPEVERIRFQVLSPQCDAVLKKLRSWGWEPISCGSGMRFTEVGVLMPCSTYELDMHERQPIPQEDRTVRSEISSKENSPPTREADAVIRDLRKQGFK